jgi:CDP-ribitol ribitolphosphotransferase
MRMHRNYDAVLCGGPAAVPSFAEAFGTDPSRILPLGLPRVDYLLSHATDTLSTTCSERVRDLAERFPRIAEPGRTIVMYAPTFRGRHTEPPGQRDVDALSELVAAFAGDRFTLILKPHALKATGLSGEHVVDATGMDSLQLMPLCDVVITDYSAIAFEAAVLEKPVFYFVYDLDEYRVEQGLNIDPLAEMPFASARDAATLAEKIASHDYDSTAARSFKERYVSCATGGCTDRIADLVIGHLPTE